MAESAEQKLIRPEMCVSRTRLALHNLPRHVTDKDLTRHVSAACRARASKQRVGVRQVKVLWDAAKQRSQGAAFVEFGEHEQALTALRALNNNPGG